MEFLPVWHLEIIKCMAMKKDGNEKSINLRLVSIGQL
jgi:hypothetical protein